MVVVICCCRRAHALVDSTRHTWEHVLLETVEDDACLEPFLQRQHVASGSWRLCPLERDFIILAEARSQHGVALENNRCTVC